MPCDISLLERGAVCLALYPYSVGFPLDRVIREVEDELNAQLERHDSIESVVATIAAGSTPEVALTMKLRRVLLLQQATIAGRQDVTVARIVSISDKKREKANWYKKLQSGIHPVQYLIGHEDAHGTNGQEAYVDLLHVARIQKAAILQRTGRLTDDEMRDINERLMRALEVDMSRQIAEAAARLAHSELARQEAEPAE